MPSLILKRLRTGRKINRKCKWYTKIWKKDLRQSKNKQKWRGGF